MGCETKYYEADPSLKEPYEIQLTANGSDPESDSW